MKKSITQAWCWSGGSEPQDLVFRDVYLPARSADHVIVENIYSSLNPVDWKLLDGKHGLWQPGHIPGVDGMGIVRGVGANYSHIEVGSKVCYHCNLQSEGSFSKYSVVHGRSLIVLPQGVSDEAAAAFPCPGLTAWQALEKLPDVNAKDVVINGAGGAVGMFLLQLALTRGARVHAICGRKNHELFYELGVSSCVDYKKAGWQAKLEKALCYRKAFALVDLVGAQAAEELLPMLGYGGHAVCVQGRISNNTTAAFANCISLHEVALGAAHQHADERYWARLREQGRLMLADISVGKLMLPKIEIQPAANLPLMLDSLKNKNSARKYLAKW